MIQTKTLDGRTHYVVPMVMIKAGVLNGSQGAIFYGSDELEKSVQRWNGVPVVVNHPIWNGQSVSASDPRVVDQYKIGVVLNTRYENMSLVADAWIDQEKAAFVDNRIIRAIVAKQKMEVSTGLFFDGENSPGTWFGLPYKMVARNHRPDHLAILPDQVGACSLQDGCGLVMNRLMQPIGLAMTFE